MKKRVFLGEKVFHNLREQYTVADCVEFEYMGVEFFYSDLMEPYDIFSTDDKLKSAIEAITPNRPPIVTPMANGTIDVDHGRDIWASRD